jgi:hypothetical protein
VRRHADERARPRRPGDRRADRSVARDLRRDGHIRAAAIRDRGEVRGHVGLGAGRRHAGQAQRGAGAVGEVERNRERPLVERRSAQRDEDLGER